jgi:hypothetical protein
MGVVHLASLGVNPGAVTAAVGYMKHNQGQFDTYREKGDIIESVVLFASYDVVEGRTTVDECVFNEYAELRARRVWRRRDWPSIVSIVQTYIEQEIAPLMPPKGKIYLWPVNPNDFDACFAALADATLALGDPDGTGKHLWANLTGGTNILNAALFDVASLSGLIARLYYTFVPNEANRKYLQPPTRDPSEFDWRWVPLTKTTFDEHYYQVVYVLRELDQWCLDADVLSILKGDAISGEYFRDMDLPTFRAQFLNRMDRYELERDGHRVRLHDDGRRILQRIRSPRFQALVRRGRGVQAEDRERLKDLLKEHELWSK